MISLSHRTLLFALVWMTAWTIPASAADKSDSKPADRQQIEPAEPKVPESIRSLLEDRKYAEAAAAIDKAAGEKDADHQWLAYLKARALYLAGSYDDAVAAFKAAEQKYPE